MTRLPLVPVVLLLAGHALPARAAEQAAAPAADGGVSTATLDAALLRAVWSVTPLVQYTRISSGDADDGLGGFFDQTEFTPDEDGAAPVQIGVRDAALDLLGSRDTALFQLRLRSPTSNQGLSGDTGDPFFSQRLTALTRLGGLALDLDYWRWRTEQLRIFPNGGGGALVFGDRSSADDRFRRDRTGFRGEARLRLDALGLADPAGLRPELSVRGGYESREGDRQLRFHRDPSGQWLGLSQDFERSVADVGGGVLLAPGGWLTLALDFDHQRFRFDSTPITEGDLGFPPPRDTRSVRFVPGSDRYTGTLRWNARLGDRAFLEGGVQLSVLEQAGRETPRQRSAGLDDNQVRSWAADAALEVELAERLSLHGFVEFDRRDNEIERDTALFNPVNGTQPGPFLDGWDRFEAGGELVLHLAAGRAALGVRYEDVSRDLDFGTSFARILPENAHVRPDTRVVTAYGRAALHPVRGVRIDAELGYRWAPRTGYVVDLDDDLYGELRATWVLPLRRPLVLSAFARGRSGENRDFDLVSGAGPVPAGPELSRSFERSSVAGGLTASFSPWDRLSVFASLFAGRDDQDASLDLSTLQRYFQDLGPFFFSDAGTSRFENQQWSVIVGSHVRLSERTDARLAYSLTGVRAEYDGGASPELRRIAASQVIDSTLHGVDLELGHELRPGLRVFAGYRLGIYDDDEPHRASVASAVEPYDLSTHQHTVSLGVTLTSELGER